MACCSCPDICHPFIQVYFAVKLLVALGQHKTARRLKYGHMAWQVQNSSKTDRNLFFSTLNLQQLQARLDPLEAGELTGTGLTM